MIHNEVEVLTDKVLVPDECAFAGTNRGEVYVYNIKRPLQSGQTEEDEDLTTMLPNDLLGTVAAQFIRSSKTPGDKPIENLHAMSCGSIEVLIARNAQGAVFLMDPRELTVLRTMSLKATGMCCNDGLPYLGLCLYNGSQLLLYDLQRGLEPIRRFNIPEAPQRMAWLRGQICLGFRDVYVLLDEDTGDISELCKLDSKVPIVIKQVPSEELVLSVPRAVILTDYSGKDPQKLQLMHQPKSCAFTFPYIYSLTSSDAIEIRNIHDQLFHEVLRGPMPGTAMTLLADDGRHVFVVIGSQVHLLAPTSYRYQMGDLQLFCRIASKVARAAPQDQLLASPLADIRNLGLDKTALISYMTGLFQSDKSPWKQLIMKFVYKFHQKFPYPESATLERAKYFVTQYMRCIYRCEASFFAELSSPQAKELVYVTTQAVFFAHVFGIVSAIVKDKFADSDKLYAQKLQELSGCTIGDLNIRKKFHLSPESLLEEKEKPPPSHSLPTSPIRITRNRSPTKVVQKEELLPIEDEPAQLDEAKSATPPADSPQSSPVASLPDGMQGLPQLFSVGDATLLEKEASGDKLVPVGHVQLVYDSDYVLHINKYESTGFEELKLDSKFFFDETEMTVTWKWQGVQRGLRFDQEDVFKQFCLQYQLYESQSALSESSARFGSSTMSSPMSRSSSGFFFGTSPRFTPGDDHNGTPSTPIDSLPSSMASSGGISLGPAIPVPVPTPTSSVSSASSSASSAVVSPRMTPSVGGFSPSSTSPASASSPHKTHIRRSSKPLFDDLDDLLEEFEEPKAFKRLRPGSRSAPRSPQKQRPGLPKYSLHADPYVVAIKTLKRLPNYRSPREKVECMLKALNQTVQAISAFWKGNRNKDIIVGADDLVPIFSYVVLRAAIPSIYFEMNFSMEFASESTLRGKYGYALATLQAAVEHLLIVTPPEIAETEEDVAPAANPAPQPAAPRPVRELSETDFEVISHSPLHDFPTDHIDAAKLQEESDADRSQRFSRLINTVDKLHERKHRDSSNTGIDSDLQQAALSPQKQQATSKTPAPPSAAGSPSVEPVTTVFHETAKVLSKFGLHDDPTEAVVEWFTCNITAPISSTGWLYVMNKHYCFEAGPHVVVQEHGQHQTQPTFRAAIAYHQVTNIRKTWAFLSPGAIEITTSDKKTFVFRNFRDRDATFAVMQRALDSFRKEKPAVA